MTFAQCQHIKGLGSTKKHMQTFKYEKLITDDRIESGVKCRVATVKRLPVLHHSADYISISFEIILVSLKIEYPLSRLVCSLENNIATYEET